MGFHIVKRDACPMWKKCIFYFIAVFVALVAGGVLLFSMSVNPFDYYYQMFTMGTVGNRIAYKTYMNYINEYLPLVLTSVALSLAFKMKFWNIGGEGQFIVGAISSGYIALKLGPELPMWLTLVLMCLAAMIVSGLYGLLAAFLKVKFGTNETLMTLMLNYIALYFLYFIGETKEDWNLFLQPQSPRPVFQSFKEFAAFPLIPVGKKFSLTICFVLTVVIGIIVFVYSRHTKHGYELSVVGDSSNTAKYAGMKVNRVVLRTVFISAALIGLAAAFKVGTTGELSLTITEDSSKTGVGWTGIIVAWLSQLNTGMIFIVSALICVLRYGSTIAAATFAQVDSSFANILQGVILFLVLAADFFIRFRIVRTKKGESTNG